MMSALKMEKNLSVSTNCSNPVGHYMRKLAPNVKVSYTRYNDRNKKSGDYFMFISRFVNKKLMENGAWPPADVIYEEKVDNTTIGAISKRPNSQLTFEASDLEKKKDFAGAEAKFLQATQKDPKDEASWLGLANSRLNLRKFPEAKVAIDEFLKLSDTHVNGLFALALYYLNTGKSAEAKQTLEKLTQVNYKYNGSYFYLASIYAQEKQFEKALGAAEMYDEVGGRALQIYDIGIQAAQQLNVKPVQLYLQAKKAYLQSDGSGAINFLNQALRADSNYEPAVKFDKQLKEQIEKQKNKK